MPLIKTINPRRGKSGALVGASVKVDLHFDEIVQRVAKQRIKTVLREEVEKNVESIAIEICPFKTGALQSTIHTIDRSKGHEIIMTVAAGGVATNGVNVDYAGPVEFGTAKRDATPFLRPAMDEGGPKAMAAVLRRLKRSR